MAHPNSQSTNTVLLDQQKLRNICRARRDLFEFDLDSLLGCVVTNLSSPQGTTAPPSSSAVSQVTASKDQPSSPPSPSKRLLAHSRGSARVSFDQDHSSDSSDDERDRRLVRHVSNRELKRSSLS
eukprot:m.34024 g.34024  ORF g.34024 m.34024 type:complete len:125 (+) comp12268_c0_seq1:1303-1677(+)